MGIQRIALLKIWNNPLTDCEFSFTGRELRTIFHMEI